MARAAENENTRVQFTGRLDGDINDIVVNITDQLKLQKSEFVRMVITRVVTDKNLLAQVLAVKELK